MAKEFVNQEYVAATNGKGLHQDSKATRILARVTVTGSILVTLVSVAMIAFCVFFAMCPVIGTSMMKTLNASGNNTDSAITCIIGEPQHSDIVVCKLYLKNTRAQFLNNDNPAHAEIIKSAQQVYTESDNNGNYMYIVKRLIGKPGDHISMCRVDENYYIYLNGIKLDESYLDPLVAHHGAMNFVQLWNVLNNRSYADMNDWVTVPYEKCVSTNTHNTTTEGEASQYMLIVPDNCYFLMGDNRGGNDRAFNHSWDSTYFGPLPIENYVSRCVDVIGTKLSMPQYLWGKFVYYVCFGWAWQK